jgi:hypothetical protein
MTTNITTLAINLLIAGRLEYRQTLSDKIMVLLQQCDGISESEKELKSYFLVLVNQCVEDPTSESRNDFYQLAEFFNTKINGKQAKVAIAA